MNILVLNKPINPRLTLLTLHHVGGNANVFRDLAKNVESEGIETFGISLPGRIPKHVKEIIKDIPTIVETAYNLIERNREKLKLDKNPLVLFGHSLGGIIAYELTRKFALEKNDFQVKRLYLSAVTNPKHLSEINAKLESPHHLKSDDHLDQYLRSIGGLPNGIDPSILKAMLPVMKGDYAAFETYKFHEFETLSDVPPKAKQILGTTSDAVVNCPITAFLADGDISVKEEAMSPWENYTIPGQFELIHVGGSHFYITEEPHRKMMYEKLISSLRKERSYW